MAVACVHGGGICICCHGGNQVILCPAQKAITEGFLITHHYNDFVTAVQEAWPTFKKMKDQAPKTTPDQQKEALSMLGKTDAEYEAGRQTLAPGGALHTFGKGWNIPKDATVNADDTIRHPLGNPEPSKAKGILDQLVKRKITPVTPVNWSLPIDLSGTSADPSVYYNGTQTLEDMITEFGLDDVVAFCRVNAFKYKARAGKKAGNTAEQDLTKALWYAERAVELLKRKGATLIKSMDNVGHD